MGEREALRNAVPAQGLDAPLPARFSGGGRLRDLAREVLDIAHAGLSARARHDEGGSTEAGFLEPLLEIAESGKVPAQRLLDKFHGSWAGDMTRVYEESF
jgi:glutamate--cysteine ligase